ncbi:lymphocyte activation gene 3 protein-like [Takifugu rubripes]|nr:lymphocyte activation gene 3 protein-like [Takifugu rubripes]
MPLKPLSRGSQCQNTKEKMLSEFFIFGLVMTSAITGGECEVTEVFAQEGSEAFLSCKCDPSSPNPASVIWTKHDKGTVWRKTQSGLQFWGTSWLHKKTPRVQCPHYRFERRDYSLQINSVKLEDAGLFSCRVGTADGVIKHQVMLRIIQVSISPSAPIWDSTFSISCDVTPPAEGATVQWTLNNISSIEAIKTLQVAPTKSLVSGRASARLEGNWTCVVGYKGEVGRASVTLAMKGIIQPPKDDTKVYAALGSAATLPCVFSPGLIPSSSGWEKLESGFPFKAATSPLPASFSQPTPSSQPSVDKSAILTEVRSEDEGTYRCSGTVEGRQLTRNLHLVVAKVVNLANKAGSVTMSCHLSDTSEVTRYEWVHQDFDQSGNLTVVSIHKGKDLTVAKKGDDKGEWTCRFYGKQGILGNVTHHMAVMSSLGGQNSGVSHKAAAAGVLSILLIVLLLVLVQMCRNHRRRKRILQYPTLETIVHRISNEREEREKNREKK